MNTGSPRGPLFDGNDLVAVTIARIRQFEPPEGYYVAFSGGKDSIVLLDLIRRAGVKHDAHYNLTTVDPPELVHFIRQAYPSVLVHRPQKTMWELIVWKQMPPTRIIRYCCEWLKEGRGNGHIDRDRLVVTGVRWAESTARGKRRMIEICRRDPSKRYFHPIIDWAEHNVWGYIRDRALRYCSLYDEGWKRIGCVMCPMAGTEGMLRDAARWPKIAEAYKRAFQRCIDIGKAKGHTDFRSGSTGQEMFDWWVGGGSLDEEDGGQMGLFE